MSVVGQPSKWADLIEPMVPQILNLVIASWKEMSPPGPNATEDKITETLCRALKQNRDARSLMFRIDIQWVELDPGSGLKLGRLDIVFSPLIPREDIYFCLEAKRLNVIKDGATRAYAAEYIVLGMMRFVTGQYSKSVRHGGMVAYVLDGKVARAIRNVELNIRRHCAALCMAQPESLLPSAAVVDNRVRETHHHRAGESHVFRIHHLFMTP